MNEIIGIDRQQLEFMRALMAEAWDEGNAACCEPAHTHLNPYRDQPVSHLTDDDKRGLYVASLADQGPDLLCGVCGMPATRCTTVRDRSAGTVERCCPTCDHSGEATA